MHTGAVNDRSDFSSHGCVCLFHLRGRSYIYIIRRWRRENVDKTLYTVDHSSKNLLPFLEMFTGFTRRVIDEESEF